MRKETAFGKEMQNAEQTRSLAKAKWLIFKSHQVVVHIVQDAHQVTLSVHAYVVFLVAANALRNGGNVLIPCYPTVSIPPPLLQLFLIIDSDCFLPTLSFVPRVLCMISLSASKRSWTVPA